MFIFLSKLLPLFVYPLGLACTLIILGLIFWKKAKASRLFIILSLFVLFFCGNRYVVNIFAKTLEWKYPTLENTSDADAIVVLGGGTEPFISPRPMVEVNAAGDRVIYAAKLSTVNPQAKIIVSGGDIDFMDQSDSDPASDMAELLKLMDIPENSIIIQNQSQNTYEDALFSCQIIKDAGYKKVLLVTSAFHMPRSILLFEKQGCQVNAAPTDYTITHASWEMLWHPSPEEFFLNLVPSYSNLSMFTKTMKEYLGMFTYRLKGWL